jgi:hypothetical protein
MKPTQCNAGVRGAPEIAVVEFMGAVRDRSVVDDSACSESTSRSQVLIGGYYGLPNSDLDQRQSGSP